MKHGKAFLQGKFHLADCAFHLSLLCPVSSFLLLFVYFDIMYLHMNVLNGGGFFYYISALKA